MRKCHYGILAAVFSCMWQTEKTVANNGYLKYIEPFLLYNDADWLYNGLNTLATQSNLDNAEEYANNHSSQLVNKDHIIKQHIYMSALRNHGLENNLEVIRSFIMLNADLTFEAYEAAVIFRVCAFYYSHVIKVEEKEKACMNLSLYMEWYFSFMLQEKAEDLCKIKTLFPEERSSPLKAENMCEILKKLNLNFLRFPEDPARIHPLPYNDNNVYNVNKLTYSWNGQRFFISVFQRYLIPTKLRNQTQEQYYEMVYNDLWNSVMGAYTDNFLELFIYLSEVTKGLPHKRTGEKTMVPFQFHKVMWHYAPLFDQFRTLPTETQRGAVWYTSEGNFESNFGSIMYRSNAVEILRQISCHCFLSTPTSAGLNVYEIMKIVNTADRKCNLIPAKNRQHLSVDYVFEIDSTEIIPLLSPK